jgi:hypothetical protein
VGGHLMMVEKGLINQTFLYHEVRFVTPTIIEHPQLKDVDGLVSCTPIGCCVDKAYYITLFS